MNAVEIEEAVSRLAEQPFDSEAFPFAFLEAFGNKETTLKRLRSGNTNQSDLPGGLLQRNNIHLKVCPEGEVTATLAALRESPASNKQKAKFILATDGKTFEAENLVDGETVACDYTAFPDPHRVWMREYWDRFIRDTGHLRATIDYIHRNPVKAGLCREPEDWPWSSAGSVPGSADVPVGMVNEKANEKAVNVVPLAPHSQASEDVGVPRADDDVGVPRP